VRQLGSYMHLDGDEEVVQALHLHVPRLGLISSSSHSRASIFFRCFFMAETPLADTPAAAVAPANRFLNALVPELLEVISDFLGPSPFTQLCSAVYNVIAGRHLRVRPLGPQSPTDFEGLLCRWLPRIRTLDLHVPGTPSGSHGRVNSLRVLTNAPALERLRLAMSFAPFPMEAAEGLTVALRAPRLRALDLDLFNVGFSSGVLEVLCGMPESAHLETVKVRFWLCSIEGPVAAFLAAISRMPRLTDLTWELEGAEGGIQTIEHIVQGKSLRRLALSFSGHTTGLEKAASLRALDTMVALEDLQLILRDNHLGPADALALAELRNAPRLTRLVLSLGHNQLKDLGVTALAGLYECPVLRSLTLNLERNDIRGGGSLPLQRLASIPTLRSVVLNLSYNPLTNADAPTMRAFRTAPQLSDVDINFEDTPYSLAPARLMWSGSNVEQGPIL